MCLAALLVWAALAPPAAAQEIPHPTDYFGFEIGTDGELARYPRILEYLQLLANRSERVDYERRGTTTLGNPYVLATISSPANLARLDRLIEINHRLNDPRGLSETEALALAREGVPFYFLYATIHSTEVGNTQALIKIAHRLATDRSPAIGALHAEGKGVWRLGDIVDYGYTAVFAALDLVAKTRTTWMENYYRVHRDWGERDTAPWAFAISADQRDPFATYELLERGEVQIDQARSTFTAEGRRYPAGSWVIRLAQPAGAFAKTMLERQVYPDLRYYPGGPPIPPYDVTAQTLGLLMGVDVEQIDPPLTADLEPLRDITAETVSRYPDEDDMVASGWLLGGELLRNQANVVSFTVGRGAVVTFGSQIAFRTQTRGTFKLLFNAIFQGSAEPIDAGALARLE